MTEKTSFLTGILLHKHREVSRQQLKIPLHVVQQQAAVAPPVRDFAAALQRNGSVALIAEVKKASPSKGVLLENFDHLELAQTYMRNGAAAISVLTDMHFFQGSLKFLQGIRAMQTQPAPLLRKDFLLDPYQVYESRAYGADAILLIVAALDDAILKNLLELTYALGMAALVEVHAAEEVYRALEAGARIIGVNNRNLHTFETNLTITEHLASLLPTDASRPILVSESGISTSVDIARLRSCGVDAVLVGEALVKSSDIGARVRELANVQS